MLQQGNTSLMMHSNDSNTGVRRTPSPAIGLYNATRSHPSLRALPTKRETAVRPHCYRCYRKSPPTTRVVIHHHRNIISTAGHHPRAPSSRAATHASALEARGYPTTTPMQYIDRQHKVRASTRLLLRQGCSYGHLLCAECLLYEWYTGPQNRASTFTSLAWAAVIAEQLCIPSDLRTTLWQVQNTCAARPTPTAHIQHTYATTVALFQGTSA